MRALITGASSGIGRDMAIYLASKGYDLVVVGRNTHKLEELKIDYGGKNIIDIKNKLTLEQKITKNSVSYASYSSWFINRFCKRFFIDKDAKRKRELLAETLGLNNYLLPSFYDVVIPPFFDLDEFEYNYNDRTQNEDRYFAFLGRIGDHKGVNIAIQVCQMLGVKLKIGGQPCDEYKNYN